MSFLGKNWSHFNNRKWERKWKYSKYSRKRQRLKEPISCCGNYLSDKRSHPHPALSLSSPPLHPPTLSGRGGRRVSLIERESIPEESVHISRQTREEEEKRRRRVLVQSKRMK